MTDNTVLPEGERPPAMPRWVKVFGIGVGIVILAVVVMVIGGIGGSHGPGRHLPSSGAADSMPAPVTTDVPAGGSLDGHAPPMGAHP